MAYIQPDPPFLPRPRGPFSESGDGGTDPNGVPWCPVDVPCGWECPRCHRIWNPSVLACHNCPEPPAFIAKTGIYPVHIDGMTCDPPCKDGPCGSAIAMSLTLPAEMSQPGRQRYVRIGEEWNEVIPGLQCRYGGADPIVKGFALFCLRLTPARNDPGPIETGR
jgi:hypothetical protein